MPENGNMNKIQEEYISEKDILDELNVMNAQVNDMDAVKKEIEKYYNNPELINNISNPQEKEFYEKMVDIYSNNKSKGLSNEKKSSLKLTNDDYYVKKESGFVSLIYVTALLLILLALLSIL